MTLRILCSFHYYRNTDLAELAGYLHEASGQPVDLFADSGAFSAATQGLEISPADYRAWLTDWRAVFGTAATLDVIGNPAATARNTALLQDAGLKVLPVFHVGSPWPVLEDLCSRYGYVALGGMVPRSRDPRTLLRWLVRAFRIAREHGTVFHGFGMTNDRLLLRPLPFYSVDSSSWANGAKYGSPHLWDETRKQVVRMPPLNRPGSLDRARHLLLDNGLDPLEITRPGFLRGSDRRYREDRKLLLGVSALAWMRLEGWLQERHAVLPPEGRTDPGTVIYLADTARSDGRMAAEYIGAREAARVH